MSCYLPSKGETPSGGGTAFGPARAIRLAEAAEDPADLRRVVLLGRGGVLGRRTEDLRDAVQRLRQLAPVLLPTQHQLLERGGRGALPTGRHRFELALERAQLLADLLADLLDLLCRLLHDVDTCTERTTHSSPSP